ncbi:MAG: hypothetical protein HY735_08750 [Verrucomicrobia bacterium]|nr:hypothetical protein [Verrucomicrobiota bacterium]
MTNDTRTKLGQLLNAFLPDWKSLERQAADATSQQKSIGINHWSERASLDTKRSLGKGMKCDVWVIPDGVCLHARPGILDQLFASVFGMLGRVLAPLLTLWKKVEERLQEIAVRLGALSILITLPFAIIGLVWDFFTVWLREIFSVALNPFALVVKLIGFPLWLLKTLVSRTLSSLLSAWSSKMIGSLDRLAAALAQRHWVRGILLGLLRRDRPFHPIMIHRDSVSQVIITTKRGLFGSSQYLIIVEGDSLEPGLAVQIFGVIKRLFFPFYWERTVHVLALPTRQSDVIFQTIIGVLNKDKLVWEDRYQPTGITNAPAIGRRAD